MEFIITSAYILATVMMNSISQAPVWHEIVAGVLIPLGAAALMLVGPLLLYRRQFDEAMDGFAFGVASGLGFSLATNLVDQWPQLSLGNTSHPTISSALVILARGLLLPFIAGSATGLIAAAVWLHKGARRPVGHHRWTAHWLSIVPAMAVMWVILGLTNIYVTTVFHAVLIYAVVAAILLISVRISIHHMLLGEAVRVEAGPPVVCFHCHYHVPRMAFCPHCGVATRSTPKHGAGRLARSFR